MGQGVKLFCQIRTLFYSFLRENSTTRHTIQGFPMLSARPHPAPFFVSVPCRAEPDTAHSPIFYGVGRPLQREAGENWKALHTIALHRSIQEDVNVVGGKASRLAPK